MTDIVKKLREQREMGLRGPIVDTMDAAADEIERMRATLAAMQGHTFFCQDPEGVLRRWHPPAES